jgi:hypothetical protein
MKHTVQLTTVSFTDLDQGREMFIFDSILTTFKACVIERGCLGSIKLSRASTRITISKFSLPKSVKHTVRNLLQKSIRTFVLSLHTNA